MEKDRRIGSFYFMEHAEEADRLEMKTDGDSVARQAAWAGLAPGMKVLDLGCGTGKTSFFLHRMVQPGGTVLGVDRSESRIDYARANYGGAGLDFLCRDVLDRIEDIGGFDFIWIRFFLQYFRRESAEIVKKAVDLLRPGGIVCLVDQDLNSVLNYGIPDGMQKKIEEVIRELEKEHNFDPNVGRKLYSFLFDAGLQEIEVRVEAHNLIYGLLSEQHRYNLRKKIEVAARSTATAFADYPGGVPGFLDDFKNYFEDPRRFSYSPLILCRGSKRNQLA